MGGVAMNCIKCGRETENEAVFCAECLAHMERHPVKPGTVVLLPPKGSDYVPKKQARKRRTLTPEEQIKRLKRRNRILSAILVLVLAIAGFFGYIAREAIGRLDIQKFWGQNYSSITDSSSYATKLPLP